MNDDINLIAYKVGGLLYTPALNETIADKIINGSYKCLTSIAFCLEDSIQDEALEDAEKQLVKTLSVLKGSGIKLPLLFVRVRTPEHLYKIHTMIGDTEEILTGYILPKFDGSNSTQYISIIKELNTNRKNKIYIMPILESKAVADINERLTTLMSLKQQLDTAAEYVLNIRVGGNDLSNMYGIRRNVKQNIYEIGVIRDVLIDIINVFAANYVVSGAVWEYFGDDENGDWSVGLKKEIEMDLINGFIGKTAVHPTQLPVIFNSLRVSKSEYQDAVDIVNWNSKQLGVSKNAMGNRMNEVKCHTKWAKRILAMAQVYGIREDLF